jgi:hypothetical protein
MDILDKIVESVVSGNMQIVYSDTFRDILISIDNKWTKILLRMETNKNDNMTLLDITERNDVISFIQSNRIKRDSFYIKTFSEWGLNDEDSKYYSHIIPKEIKLDSTNPLWKSNQRNQISIGRWFRRVLHEINDGEKPTSKDLEDLVNSWKSQYDISKNPDESGFELVEGEEIRHWYDSQNYLNTKGQLGNSCMRYEECQEFFDIYVRNPEVCKMLILKSGSYITGRALIWKLKDGRYYQDRIYTNGDSDVIRFKRWADKRGYLFHSKDREKVMEVQLKSGNYSPYPYMDTFVCYNPKTYILSSDLELWPGKGYIKLNSAEGGWESDMVVWSDYYESWIGSETAVDSHYKIGSSDTTWINEWDAFYIKELDQYWLVNVLNYSRILRRYIHPDIGVKSRLMEDFLIRDSDDTIEVIISSDEIDYVHISRTDLYREIEGIYYSKKHTIWDFNSGKFIFINENIIRDVRNKLQSEYSTFQRRIETLNMLSEKVFKIWEDIKSKKTDLIISEIKKWDGRPNSITESDIIFLILASITSPSSNMGLGHSLRAGGKLELEDKWLNLEFGSRIRTYEYAKSFEIHLFGEEIYKIYLLVKFTW